MTPKSNRLLRLFKRFILVSTAIIIFLLILSTILFKYYRDDIARTVLLKANTIQHGELTFKDVSFNPFVHFPNVSIELDSALYYEQPAENREEDSIPIIALNRLYMAFDLVDLLKGDINVSKILLENGSLNLITYADNTLNLMNAFGSSADSIQIEADSIEASTDEFELNLERIALRNITISHHYIPNSVSYFYEIPSLKASLNYWPDTIKCSLNADLILRKVKITDGLILEDKKVVLGTSFALGRKTNKLIIEPSRLMFEKSSFTIEGSLGLDKNGFINLGVKGDDRDFRILDLFLTNAGIENIRNGDLFFEGTIKGKLYSGIPMIDCSFGFNEVEIQIPNTNKSIRQLSLNGSFKSGIRKDLSGASLDIRQMKALLPGGKLDGKLKVRDFVSPNIDLSFYLKSKVDGFHEIFDLGEIDSLVGGLEIKSEIKGKINLDDETFDDFMHNSVVRFDSISFVIPDINRVRKMHGRIEIEKDTVFFSDFDFWFGTSDFKINGRATNVLYTFLDVEKEIEADLRIKSAVYDFPDFFSWDQKIATGFPYRIKNINLSVNLHTSTNDLKNFIKVPKIIFSIRHLDAEIEDFLPPVSIKTGLFTLADKDSTLHLDFDRFAIEMAGSKLKTEMDFYSPPVDPDWLRIDLDATGINPKKTFAYWFNDSIGEYFDGKLDGKMHLDLILSRNSLLNFDKLDFTAARLDYVNAIDTFQVNNLRFDSKDISYDLSKTSNIWETLSLESKLIARSFVTNHFELDDADYDINAEKGVYHIQPQNSQFFDQVGEGYVILRPHAETPSYEIKYKVSQFDVARLFDTFLEDTVLTGKMDLDLDMKFFGEDWDEIKSNLDGYLLLNGKDLTLYGLDLDKVIDRFKRSQRFTFADLGAVLLMGPAGILVTKGSDYASIAILNRGDSSRVFELSSDWEFSKGVISLADVAFTTEENRMAARGSIDLVTDTLSIQIALLNPQGCSVFSQSISGKIEEPDMGKVKVVKSLLAPITNMVDKMAGTECEVFYDGRVKHPGK